MMEIVVCRDMVSPWSLDAMEAVIIVINTNSVDFQANIQTCLEFCKNIEIEDLRGCVWIRHFKMQSSFTNITFYIKYS